MKLKYLKGLQGCYKDTTKDCSVNLAGILPLNLKFKVLRSIVDELMAEEEIFVLLCKGSGSNLKPKSCMEKSVL